MEQIDWTSSPIFYQVRAFGSSLGDFQNEQGVYNAVRNFALKIIPPTLTRREQDSLSGVFYEVLDGSHDHRYRLMLHFRSNLRPTTDPLSYHSSNDLVRDFAQNTIANLNDIDRIQTEIEHFCATLVVTQELRDVLIIQFKWNIDNLRPDFPYIMGLFQGYMQERPQHTQPRPMDRFTCYTPLLTIGMWRRIYQARPHLTLPPGFILPPGPPAIASGNEPVLPPEPTCLVRTPLHGASSDDPRMIQESFNYVSDMLSLQFAVKDVTQSMLGMLGVVLEYLEPVPDEEAGQAQEAHQMLQKSLADLNGLLFLQKGRFPEISLENLSDILRRLEREQGILDGVRARNFKVEHYLVGKETSLHKSGHKLHSATIRFRRSSYRQDFKSTIESFKSERLRQVDYTENVLHSWETGREVLFVPGFRRDDTLCSICYEDLADEDGEIGLNLVGTPCCQSPFHVQCIAKWLFTQLTNGQDMKCSLCRGSMNKDYLADVLEMGARSVAVL